MARGLTNKQVVVLEVVRQRGPLTVNEISDAIEDATPCAECDGSGEGETRWGCRACYGHGHVLFGYSTAYVCLMALRRQGFVTRRCKRDQFGDELSTHVYEAAAVARSDDPLEELWNAPTTAEPA